MGRYKSNKQADTNQPHHSVDSPLSLALLLSLSLLVQTSCVRQGEVRTEQTPPLNSWLSSVWVGCAGFPEMTIK